MQTQCLLPTGKFGIVNGSFRCFGLPSETRNKLCIFDKNIKHDLTIITILTNELIRTRMNVVTRRAEEKVTFTCEERVKVTFFYWAGNFFPTIVRR